MQNIISDTVEAIFRKHGIDLSCKASMMPPQEQKNYEDHVTASLNKLNITELRWFLLYQATRGGTFVTDALLKWVDKTQKELEQVA